MPEQLINQLRKKIKPEWKLAFYSSVIIGLIVHLFVFTNRLMNHDSLHNIYNTQAKVQSGRFFLGPASGISSYFDLPWIIGLLSILFLAFAVICIVELFELRKTLSIIIVSGLVVGFPSVTATFSYMYTADGYMLGAFFALLAILLTKKYKFGFIFGAFLLCISIGIYQANLSVVLAFSILWLFREVLCFNISNKNLFVYVTKFGAMTIFGLSLYYVAYKIYTTVYSINMTSYQGLDKVGQLSLEIIPKRVFQMKEQLKEFFFRGFFTFYDVNLFEVLNVLIILTIVVVIIYLIIKQKIYKDFVKLPVIILLIASLPFAYYIVYFISPDAFYHMLMLFSLSSVYIFLILIYDTVDSTNPNKFQVVSSWLTVILLSVTVFNFALIANITYFNMEVRYEKSAALVNRILDRIEHLDNYEEIENLAVIGKVSMYSELSSVTIPNSVPPMMGALGETFLAGPYHYQAMLENYFGFKLELVSEEELAVIKESKEFLEMDIWPAASSVRSIGETVIIKFAEND